MTWAGFGLGNKNVKISVAIGRSNSNDILSETNYLPRWHPKFQRRFCTLPGLHWKRSRSPRDTYPSLV
jgi:hypothetical protein